MGPCGSERAVRFTLLYKRTGDPYQHISVHLTPTIFSLLFRLHFVHAVHRCGLMLLMLRHLSVCVCFCLSDTLMNTAKTAEPIEMPFNMWTLGDPRNQVLGGSPESPWKRAIFGLATQKVSGSISGRFASASGNKLGQVVYIYMCPCH